MKCDVEGVAPFARITQRLVPSLDYWPAQARRAAILLDLIVKVVKPTIHDKLYASHWAGGIGSVGHCHTRTLFLVRGMPIVRRVHTVVDPR